MPYVHLLGSHQGRYLMYDVHVKSQEVIPIPPFTSSGPPRRYFRRPELPFPMMVTIFFLLMSLVLRNVRKQ